MRLLAGAVHIILSLATNYSGNGEGVIFDCEREIWCEIRAINRTVDRDEQSIIVFISSSEIYTFSTNAVLLVTT